MGAFNTREVLVGSIRQVPVIANKIVRHFREQGYEVAMESLSSGGFDISISKGNMFKAILGMKTALKISLLPQNGTIVFDAGVGIFGRQVIPTLIMWYVAWPVMLTQIWGMIQQSKLDDEALSIAKKVISEQGSSRTSIDSNKKYCTSCGTPNESSSKYCCNCGTKL